MSRTIFLNNVSEKLIHRNINRATGTAFYSVSIPCRSSLNGFGTITVSEKQVFTSRTKDGDEIPGCRNILLGDADKERRLSIKTTCDNGNTTAYRSVSLANFDIQKMFLAGRNAYKELHNTHPSPMHEAYLADKVKY